MKTIKGALKKIQSWTKNSKVEHLYLIGLKRYEPVAIEKIASGNEGSVGFNNITLYRLCQRLKNLYQIDSVVMVHNHPFGDDATAFEGYPSIGDMQTLPKIKRIIEEQGLFYDGDYVVSPEEIYKYNENYEELVSLTPIKVITPDEFKISLAQYSIDTCIHLLTIAERLHQNIPELDKL